MPNSKTSFKIFSKDTIFYIKYLVQVPDEEFRHPIQVFGNWKYSYYGQLGYTCKVSSVCQDTVSISQFLPQRYLQITTANTVFFTEGPQTDNLLNTPDFSQTYETLFWVNLSGFEGSIDKWHPWEGTLLNTVMIASILFSPAFTHLSPESLQDAWHHYVEALGHPFKTVTPLSCSSACWLVPLGSLWVSLSENAASWPGVCVGGVVIPSPLGSLYQWLTSVGLPMSASLSSRQGISLHQHFLQDWLDLCCKYFAVWFLIHTSQKKNTLCLSVS